MTFATIVNNNTSTTSGSSATSLVCAMPASIVAGRLLLNIAVASINDAASTAMSGWTPIAAAVQRTSSTGTIGVWGKIAAGSDTGTVTGSSGLRAAVTYQIDAWTGLLSDVKAALIAGAVSDKDPPSLTPGFGALDYLWIAAGYTNGVQTPTIQANFTNLISSVSGASRLSTSRRSFNAASLDPAAFGGGAGSPMAATIAIKPVTALPYDKSQFMPFFHHNEENAELSLRKLEHRRSGLYVPKRRQLTVACAP